MLYCPIIKNYINALPCRFPADNLDILLKNARYRTVSAGSAVGCDVTLPGT